VELLQGQLFLYFRDETDGDLANDRASSIANENYMKIVEMQDMKSQWNPFDQKYNGGYISSSKMFIEQEMDSFCSGSALGSGRSV